MKFLWTLTAVTLLCTADVLADAVKGRSNVERFEQKRINSEDVVESVEGRDNQLPTTVNSVGQNQRDESRYLSVNPIGSLPQSWSNQQVSSVRSGSSPQVVPQSSYWSEKSQVPSQSGRLVVPMGQRIYFSPRVATKTVQQSAPYNSPVNTIPVSSMQNVQTVSARPLTSQNQVWGQKVGQQANVQVVRPVSVAAPVGPVRNQNLVMPVKPGSVQTVSVMQPVQRLYSTKSTKSVGSNYQQKPFYQSVGNQPQPASRDQTYTYTVPNHVFQYQIKRPKNVVSTISVPSSVSRVVYNVPTRTTMVQQPIQSRNDVMNQQPDWSIRLVQPFKNVPVSVRTVQPAQSTGTGYSNYPSVQPSGSVYSNYPSVQTTGNAYSNYPSVQTTGNAYSNYPSVQSSGTVYRGYSPVQPVQTVSVVPVQSTSNTMQVVPARQIPYQAVKTVQRVQPLNSIGQVQGVGPVSSVNQYQAVQPLRQVQSIKPVQVQPVSPVQAYRVVQPTYYTMPLVINQQGRQSVQPQVASTYSVKGGQMPVTTVTIEDAYAGDLVQNQANVQSVSDTESQVESNQGSKSQVESTTSSEEVNTESNLNIDDAVVDEIVPVSPDEVTTVNGNEVSKVEYSVPVSQQEQSNQAVTENTKVQSRANWISEQQKQEKIEQVYLTDEDSTEPLQLSPIVQSSKS